MLDAELGLNDYKLFRYDRNSDTSVHTRGGSLIAVKCCLSSRAINISISCVEQLFVDIRFGHKHLIIGTIYIPPDSDSFVYESHCNAIDQVMSALPNTDFLIIGDYNLSDFQ